MNIKKGKHRQGLFLSILLAMSSLWVGSAWATAATSTASDSTLITQRVYRERGRARGHRRGTDLFQLAYELEHSAGELYYQLDHATDRRRRYRDGYGRGYDSSKYLRKARSDARGFARRAEKFRRRLNRNHDPYRVGKEFKKLHRDFYKLARWNSYLDGNRGLRRSMSRIESILYQMDDGRGYSSRGRYSRDPYRDRYRSRRRRGW